MTSPAGDLPPSAQPGPSPVSGAGTNRTSADQLSGQDGASPGGGNKVARQALWWLCLGGVLFLLLQNLGVEGALSIAISFLGLCFVIFIHELGHFAVAKWCDVHVEAFSIGFGPAVPGCSFRRGETMYKLAWFPLGGYVKMVGEGNESDEDDSDPRAFKNKSVWQRMAIFSAGVIMNMIFGLACFIFVYRAHGFDQLPAIVGSVDPSGSAWREGVRTGADIKQIGSSINPFFEDVQYEVVFNSSGEKVRLVYEVPGRKEGIREIYLEPRRDRGNYYPVIGIGTCFEMKLVQTPRNKSFPPVFYGSPAANAEPPFKSNDWIIGMTDPDHGGQVTLLPRDPRNQTEDRPDYFVYRERLRRLAGKPVVFRVSRKEDGQDKTLDIKVGPAYHHTVGLRMRMGPITAVREHSPATRARMLQGNDVGVRAQDTSKGVEGDILDQVEVTDAKGNKIRWSNTSPAVPAKGLIVKDLDPVRLPDELNEWASSVTGKRPILLTVLRKVGHVERQKVVLETEWDDDWKDDIESPSFLSSPLPIAGLGLAYRVDTVVEAATGEAEKANLKRGDVIKAIRINKPSDEYGKFTASKWMDLEPNSWGMVSKVIDEVESKSIDFRVERDKETFEVTLTAAPDETWPAIERGLILSAAKRRQKADSLLEAVSLGLRATQRSVIQIYKNLQAIVTGRVSHETVGGPIMIATTAYSLAGENIYRFLRFLGMISVNLAVINFLPIPILDGGHMVFLLYEKLRGAPASENVRAAATYAGLFLILALMVFVWWVDIARLF
jgi:regulator of sigma E protease